MWKRHIDHLHRREVRSYGFPCKTVVPKDSVASANSEEDSLTIQEEEGHEQLPSVAQAQTSDTSLTIQREQTGPPA